MPESLDAVRPGSLRAWLTAARPRTLLVAISPVIVGGALAFERTGAVAAGPAALVLGCALLVQIITNLQNDVGYTARGGERSGNRTGLPRATANGWLSVRSVRLAIVALSAIAIGLAMGLMAVRGWPVLAIGTASLVAALAYMAGPRPIAYTPLGELTVFIFFGLVAVTGTDWVLTGRVGNATSLASIAIGCLAAAALAVNNHRDADHDRSVGRRTFVAIAGARASLRLYTTLLLLPFALLPVIAFTARDGWLALPMLLLPTTIRLQSAFAGCPPGLAFNGVLFRTFELELSFAALLAVGAVVGRLLH
jgi:1,4-dihydroxy-2-naphthoate octaprenyltransferase